MTEQRAAELPPTPAEVFERSEAEGRERLMRGTLAQVSTGLTAGVNIVFAIVALGIVHHLVAAEGGESLGQLAGALAFGIGLTFLVVGRSELFTENFLDPLTARAAGIDRFWSRLAKLWGLSLVFNLAGGALLALILTTEGAMPEGAPGALVTVAEEMAAKGALADFMNAIAGGALVTLLTWLVLCVGSGLGRFAVAWAVGSLLALGPFNHVVVTVLHLFFGIRYGAAFGYDELVSVGALAVAGNLVGGILFVTLLRTGQAKG
jgi:formate-nitrite transporter family protein